MGKEFTCIVMIHARYEEASVMTAVQYSENPVKILIHDNGQLQE